jgi:hypothetical protein
LKRAGVTSKVYADRHGLSVHSLRHWLSRINAESLRSSAPQADAFVALRLERGGSASSSRTSASAPSGCTLRCSSGWELELAALPSPQWLAGLSVALREVR